MSDFKERMADAMKKRGITQADLSKKTGIPKSAISQYLSGAFEPKRERVDVICGILEVSPAWLMGYEEKENKILPALTNDEQQLILLYKNNSKIREAIDAIIKSTDSENTVFRAAKSKGGIIPPSYESMSAKKLKKLTSAPETDEDI